jgi:hypothetical protein
VVPSKVIDLTIMQGLMQKKKKVLIMLYVIFGLKFDIQFEKLCEKCILNQWKIAMWKM